MIIINHIYPPKKYPNKNIASLFPHVQHTADTSRANIQ